MQITRLSWAGLAVAMNGTTLLVDPLANASELTGLMGKPRASIHPIAPKSAQFALLTHLHPDHYNPAALRASLVEGGQVICHEPLARLVAQDGFAVKGVQREVPFTLNGFEIIAVPAVDGFGHDQVSWVIAGEGKRIVHCGDTLWHGYWWRIQHKYGPFDLAFLPINGAIIHAGFILQQPALTPSNIEASMTPEQAVAAGKVLGVKAVCPIHYGLFHSDQYQEHPEAAQRFAALAQNRGLAVLWLQPGENVCWAVV